MGWKIRIAGARLLYFLTGWPARVMRLLSWLFLIGYLPHGRHSLLRWLAGLIMLITDISPLALIYETITDLIKRKTRPLNKEEERIVLDVFGASFPSHLVGMDPNSIPVALKVTDAYVSFHTINFNTQIPDSVFVHELVHIWQFQQYGSAYISESIWAQKWGGGYNYGGIEALKKGVFNKGLAGFNFEQQADIIEDYFRWKSGLPMRWAFDIPATGDLLERYRSEVS